MRGLFSKVGPLFVEVAFILLFTGSSLFVSSCKLFDSIGSACNACRTNCSNACNWIKKGQCTEICEINVDVNTAGLNPDDAVCVKSGFFLTDGGTTFLDERQSNGDLNLSGHTKTGDVWRRTLHLKKCMPLSVNGDNLLASSDIAMSICRRRNCNSPEAKLFIPFPNSRDGFKTDIDPSNCRATITFDAKKTVIGKSTCDDCCK